MAMRAPRLGPPGAGSLGCRQTILHSRLRTRLAKGCHRSGEIAVRKQKSPRPGYAGKRALSRYLQCHAPSGGVALREQRATMRGAHAEDVKSPSCSTFTLHNNPFWTYRPPQESRVSQRRLFCLGGALERDATWSRARTVSRVRS